MTGLKSHPVVCEVTFRLGTSAGTAANPSAKMSASKENRVDSDVQWNLEIRV